MTQQQNETTLYACFSRWASHDEDGEPEITTPDEVEELDFNDDD